MKRIITIICLFLSGCYLIAQELNSEQTRLRTNIKNYLQQEGFVPSIDEDGDIAFKKEGELYWVSISPEFTTPMHVTLNTMFKNPQGYDLKTIKYAAAATNYQNSVKVLCGEESFIIQSELFVLTVEHFKYAFRTMMKRIDEVESLFLETCDEFVGVDGGPSSSNTSSNNVYTSNSSSRGTTSSSSSSYSSSSLRTITSKEVSLNVSEQVQLKVDGKTVSAWESDNDKIARVSSSGVVTGVSNGSTNVWAHYGSELKLFHISVGSFPSSSSLTSSSSYSSASSSSAKKRTINSREATIKVGEQITALLPEGKIERWEMNSNVLMYLAPTSNNTITAIKAGQVNVWGYIGESPKLFKLKIEGSGTYVPQDRAPYLVTSKDVTMYVGDQITARLSEGIVTRWEIENYNRDYLGSNGNMLLARKAGSTYIWGYIGESPKRFTITIKAR